MSLSRIMQTQSPSQFKRRPIFDQRYTLDTRQKTARLATMAEKRRRPAPVLPLAPAPVLPLAPATKMLDDVVFNRPVLYAQNRSARSFIISIMAGSTNANMMQDDYSVTMPVESAATLVNSRIVRTGLGQIVRILSAASAALPVARPIARLSAPPRQTQRRRLRRQTPRRLGNRVLARVGPCRAVNCRCLTCRCMGKK